ncbi:Phospholipase/carboxylesterase [Mycena rosella]|uniref:Acyl-protein thioesterase 1 n=1 Tax=Mycena rosella TaxID=1033263 RepID=A0AAD7C946_MYCRO|nr:Phospholipase/carboxylesterase [Mycena rosella]
MLGRRLIPGLLSAYSIMAPIVEPPAFIKVPAKNHSATVILVHGLGDSGFGMQSLASQLQSDGLGHCEFYLPHAPTRAITANGGHRMPAWFNLFSFNPPSEDDEAGMLESFASIDQLIANEIDSGIEASRIVIGGFSQGATMSLLTGMISSRQLGGVAVLSGRLPLRDKAGKYPKLKELASPHAASVPIFWGHGAVDPMISHSLGRLSADFLTSEIGVPTAPATGEAKGLTFKTYDGLAHSIGSQEMKDLGAWLNKVLPA